jgi:hypothetical protein
MAVDLQELKPQQVHFVFLKGFEAEKSKSAAIGFENPPRAATCSVYMTVDAESQYHRCMPMLPCSAVGPQFGAPKE